MIGKLFGEWQAKVLTLLYLLFFFWWMSLQMPFLNVKWTVDYFASVYCTIAIWGGIWGMKISNRWGGYKSILGRSLIFFSLGLFAQAFGQLSYSYFIVIKHIEVPYPSIGDLGYFGSIPLYVLGIYYLAKLTGAKWGMDSLGKRVQAIMLPLCMLFISYYFFLSGYEADVSRPLVVFLDFGYPLGQAIYISLAILTYLLSRRVLGGIMKMRILFILFALVIQYISDYTFLYQANRDIWQAGGINDLFYFTAYFIMALSLLQFESVYKIVKEHN